MSLSQKRRFTFTWRIQNFSMCPQKLGEGLKSPVFVVDELNESKWYLDLYPKSFIHIGMLSCYLQCRDVGYNTDDIKIGFSITAFSVDVPKRITKEVENHTFRNKGNWVFPIFVSKDVLFKDKDAYLPNDTLTLQCSLWGMDDSYRELDPFAYLLNKRMFATLSRDDMQDSGMYNCDEFSALTRVGVQKKTVSWPVRRFSSMCVGQRLTIPVRSVLKDAPSFCLTFHKSTVDWFPEIEFRRVENDFQKQTFVKCKIWLLHTPKRAHYFAVDEHFFQSNVDSVWKFPSFIKLSKLHEDTDLDETYDFLVLRFEFSFSRLGDVHHVEKEPPRQPESVMNLPQPIEETGRLLRNGESCDVTLRVGDREFEVHKVILKARSSVFSAMFDNDMKEKETGVVDITDVDPDTVDRMLDFIYTNELKDVQALDAFKLYFVADKYQVLPLKVRCTEVLVSALSVSNVYEVLSLADLHHDEYLWECAEGFIHANYAQVLSSQEWRDFIKSNSFLAATMMHKMLTN